MILVDEACHVFSIDRNKVGRRPIVIDATGPLAE